MEQGYDKQKELARAMKRCSVAEKAPYDVLESLLRKGVSLPDAEEIVNYLQKEKFVDPQRFARAYVREKMRFNKWGEYKIREMLRSKRIDAEVINTVLSDAFSESDSGEQLSQLLKKKLAGIKEPDPRKVKEKLMRFAVSRGYPVSLALEKISALMQENKKHFAAGDFD